MKISNVEQLRELYGQAKGRAKLKQLSALEQHSEKFVKLSPFCIVSTANGANELDASPRGGKPGFVYILDEKTLLIPDVKGNNRLDSLVNIIDNNQVGLLFLIPGVDETLRVNGRAEIRVDEKYVTLFDEFQNPPKSVIKVVIDEVFLHCAKALMRSKLWRADSQVERSIMPTMGKMINDQIKDTSEPESQSEMLARYEKEL